MIGGLDLAANRHWSAAGGIALAVHAAAIALAITAISRSEPAPAPEPVMLIELPPEAVSAPRAAQSSESQTVNPASVPPSMMTRPMDVPEVRAPLPSNPVTLPPPPPPLPVKQVSQVQSPASAPAASPVSVSRTGSDTANSKTPGSDPKAKQQAADYFSLVSAHLNRKKRYPSEAKKARQEGVVTVRFTVARDGSVSGVSIKKSCGYALLDQETLALMQRVAPLPKFPQSMDRDSVTLSLPIDYSLRTS